MTKPTVFVKRDTTAVTGGKKTDDACQLCKEKIIDTDEVVECEGEHILHSKCFDDETKTKFVCPLCPELMRVEDDKYLSPQKKRPKPQRKVSFADDVSSVSDAGRDQEIN